MINPHGGKLVNLTLGKKEIEKVKRNNRYKQVPVSDRYISDCEMLAIGGFSPLTGFMDKETAESVIKKMQLPNGLIWTIPIVLPVDDITHKETKLFEEIILTTRTGTPIAILSVSEKFRLDLAKYAKDVYQTTDSDHPGVKVLKQDGDKFLAGEIKLLNRPERLEIDKKYYLDPNETRAKFIENNWKQVIAFQTRNPIHRAHEYIIKCGMETVDGVLIHPLVGPTKKDDIPADMRMKCYELVIDNYFNRSNTLLSVLPTAMRYAGPREAIHHMIIRKNYGCSHMIIGRDHAGVGSYYGTYDAQKLVREVAEELEIKASNFDYSFFCKKCGTYCSSKTCPHPDDDHVHLSGTKVRAMLRSGVKPPVEFSRSEVAGVLLKWAQKLNKSAQKINWLSRVKTIDVAKTAIEAGQAILKVQEEAFDIIQKGDKTPVTQADRTANDIILKKLTVLYSGIPLLSEEEQSVDYKTRKIWNHFWLVDPLDGTREFIKRNGEFTVNIALVSKKKTSLGVIYAPTQDTLYFARRSGGAYKIEDVSEVIDSISKDSELMKSAVKLPLNKKKEAYKVIVSRSHINDKTAKYVQKLKKTNGKVQMISAGSSLKFCLVAEKSADEYPKIDFGMHEWDIAAGQIIVEEAGGKVIDYETKKPLTYNKEDLRFPAFLVQTSS